MAGWTLADLPDQAGRTALVTGATGGIGKEAAFALAGAGARVVLASRSERRLAEVAGELREVAPSADLEALVLDLADLASVRAAGERARGFGPVDILLNNAGVMGVPYARTADGLERTMATNHFGPFLLTGLLLPQLLASGDARVVTVSSGAHAFTRRPPLGDPHRPAGRYRRWVAYAQSKLANLLFTFELQRRAEAAGLPLRALAAHPGYAATNLLAAGRTGRRDGGFASILNAAVAATAQPAGAGALPLLMAATADLPGGTFCGPTGFGQQRGPVGIVEASPLAHDPRAQRRLWELSEATVGLAYP